MPDDKLVLRLILEEGGKLRPHEFQEDAITIGRTADNQVRISDALSSRQHCRVRRDGDGFVVEDLKSRNGTRLNGEALTEVRPLQPGDKIQVGESTIHFMERKDGAARRTSVRKGGAAAKPAESEPLRLADGPALEVVEGVAQGERFPVAQLPFLIGRKKGCSLPVEDEDVSNEHCMLVEDGGVLHLVDLGSTNGTFLDGERLRGRAALSRGARIRLGATLTFKAHPEGEGAAPAAKRSARTRRSARKPAPAAAAPDVAEVEHLDDLEAEPAAAPARPAARSGAAPKPAAAALPEEDLLGGVDLDARLSAAANEVSGGGGGGGAVAVGLASLLLLGTLGLVGRAMLSRPERDPRPEQNPLENWSFEETGPGGALPGWELLADDGGAARVGGGEAQYGRAAVALTVKPGARPELRSTPVRVTPGQLYRLRAAVALDPGAGVALRLDWRSESDPNFARQSVLAVLEPGGTGEWRDLSGLARAPRGADQARVVGLAFGGGRARFDRFVLSSEPADEPRQVLGPGGLELAVNRGGTLSVLKRGEELAYDVGLSLDPADPLCWEESGRSYQVADFQTDGSLLAVTGVERPGATGRVTVAFAARVASDALRLSWSSEGSPEQVHLGFSLPRLRAVAPLELDGRPFALAGEGPAEVAQVTEMSWGQAADQVSFRFDPPARLEARPLPAGGAQLWFAIAPRPLPSGEAGVTVEVVPASSSAQAEAQRLLRTAQAARDEGDYARALSSYRALAERFAHDAVLTRRASQGIEALEAEAARRIGFLDWVAREVPDLRSRALLGAGRAALAELGQRFGADSDRVQRAGGGLDRAEEALGREDRSRAAERITQLLTQGLRHHQGGRLELARELYAYVVASWGEDVPGVAEAKSRLESLAGAGETR